MSEVLYIEDNQDTANAVKMMLDNAGFSTIVANSGKEGLAILDKEKFKVILLDIMLPDMSGWDIFSRLSKDKKINARFAFLSAIPVSNERMEELKKAGVADYITKPFVKEDLISRVKKMLEVK